MEASLEHLRDLCDRAGLETSKFGDALIAEINEESFSRSVLLTMTVYKDRYQIFGRAENFVVPPNRTREAIDFCNRWNDDHCVPTAILDGDCEFRADVPVFVRDGVDDEYLRFVLFDVGVWAITTFFAEVGEAFEPERELDEDEIESIDSEIDAAFRDDDSKQE